MLYWDTNYSKIRLKDTVWTPMYGVSLMVGVSIWHEFATSRWVLMRALVVHA